MTKQPKVELNEAGASFVETYYAQYDDVAVDVISDHSPNTGSGMEMSCAAMAERVCQVMGWEDFDLLETHDFPKVYESGSAPRILVYGMIAFLRMKLFTLAEARGVGLPAVNEQMIAHSTKWNTMLFEKWNALRRGTEPSHKWNN